VLESASGEPAASRAAMRSALAVSRFMASAAAPVTGAMVAAKAVRLVSTSPLLEARAALSGCVAASNGIPSAGQQVDSLHR
jgi:hypothetical protein